MAQFRGGLGDDYYVAPPNEINRSLGDLREIDAGVVGGDDTLIGGDDADNALWGDAILMRGFGGNDTLIGGVRSTNRLVGDASIINPRDGTGGTGGDDTLIGGADSTNTLIGDASVMSGGTLGGNDTLVGGNGGSSVLIGDAEHLRSEARGGDDRLISGTGDDAMWGDAVNVFPGATTGADTFVFLPDNGTDTINDFEPGKDVIELQGFTTSAFPGSATAFAHLPAHVQATFIKPLEFDDLQIVESGADSVIHLGPDDDTVTVMGITGLDAGDFVFS